MSESTISRAFLTPLRRETHLGYLATEMTGPMRMNGQLKWRDCHYTADSFLMRVEFMGQEYEVEIREARK